MKAGQIQLTQMNLRHSQDKYQRAIDSGIHLLKEEEAKLFIR